MTHTEFAAFSNFAVLDGLFLLISCNDILLFESYRIIAVLNPITPDKETIAPVNIPVEKRLPTPETTILSKSKGETLTFHF